MVLLEGTNLSEGRGTTRPFELFGAPWLRPESLAQEVAADVGPGMTLRACHFEPTFQKHAGVVCGGAQLHVHQRDRIRSVRATVAILAACRRLAPTEFGWRPPPYEYEEVMPPIDILWGHDGLRTGIDDGASVDEIFEGVAAELEAFEGEVRSYLLYD
jgi:uncharacterized protein YbbC (DUF1343 family)